MRGGQSTWVFGTCALILGATACSLVLDDLEVTCAQGLCAALNQKYGLDASPEGDCLVYQCRADRRGCEKKMRDLDEDDVPDKKTCAGMWTGEADCDDGAKLTYPGASESCDEHDNDCDGWIDEGMLSAATLEAPDMSTLKGVLEPAELKLSALRGDAAWLAVSARTGIELRTRLLAPRGPELLPLEGAKSCDGDCNMSDVAIASSAELLLGVGISTLGCRDGQLRVAVADGVADNARTKATTWDGVCVACQSSATPQPPTSNLAFGVDRGGTTSCSLSGEQPGASAPSVGLLRDEAGKALGALALWRAGPSNGAPSPLVGLSLKFVRSIPNQGRVVSVNGAETQARSHAFDDARTAGIEAALVQPWRDSRQGGYLVAYDSAQGVELAFVPASVSPDFSQSYAITIPAPGGARSIALAFAAPEQETAPAGSEIALAFRSRADQGDDLLFARVRFDPGADPPLTLLSCGRLFEPRALLEGPTLLYHPPGFAEESAGRGGGFFLTWVERGGANARLMGARLDEAAAATDKSCRTSVIRALSEDPFPLWGNESIAHAFTFADADQTPRYAFITKDEEQRLNIGSLSCRPE